MPEEKFFQGTAAEPLRTSTRKFAVGDRVRRSDYDNDELFDALIDNGKIVVRSEQAAPAPALKAKKADKTEE